MPPLKLKLAEVLLLAAGGLAVIAGVVRMVNEALTTLAKIVFDASLRLRNIYH